MEAGFSVHNKLTVHVDPGTNRFKFTFTLRDSPSDYINATCWGSEEYIKKLHSSFKICDVGKTVRGYMLIVMCIDFWSSFVYS